MAETSTGDTMTTDATPGVTPEGDPIAEAPKKPVSEVPTVIVDNVHIVYKIYGGGGGKGSATSALSRIVKRKASPAVTEVHAVRGISFTAYKGEAIGLIGSNGSGKSTTLSAVAGLLPTASGSIYTDGQPSLLGVNAAMMSDLSGERNVVLGCLAMGMSYAEVRERYQQIVDFSGINDKGDFISLPMRTYSSGMAARLRFSIAAAKTHDVLLIDEALSTGDASFQRRSEARIKELREEAGTVFLVSHSSKSIRDTCDRTIWLEHGVIRADGPTDEIVTEYENWMKKR
ncbi:ABC transporter ATP-binding protein [Streptacidiphilus cavernicola]|uniref:ABC transporter ATP-binding protein n=1 Tax=Streptacidiphilus cavernicola TaxID=3342716 RepID=A0ABV6W6F4_9ACTN